MSHSGQNEKRYDPGDTTLKFVNRPDDLDPLPPEEGDQCLRAVMSCGHAVTPQSLTGWCRSLVDQGQFKFKCPALKEGTTQRCNQEWPYQEVRRLAVLTAEEMEYFEENLARFAAATYVEYKTCPGCKTYVERKDLTNLNVECLVCREEKRRCQFCWQCLRVWKGRAPRSDRCGNRRCTNIELQLLLNCQLTNLQELTPECLKSSSDYEPCSAGVAPRQTSIPVWRRT